MAQSPDIIYPQIAGLSTLGSGGGAYPSLYLEEADKPGVHPQQLSLHLSNFPIETIPAMNGVTGWPTKPYTI